VSTVHQQFVERPQTDDKGRHKAIVAYLGVINAPKSVDAFREEAGVSDNFDDATRKKYEGLLEKKWTSVVRLQKKVRPPPRKNAAEAHMLTALGPGTRAAQPEPTGRARLHNADISPPKKPRPRQLAATSPSTPHAAVASLANHLCRIPPRLLVTCFRLRRHHH
jgi:hypothetical protein